MYYLVYLSGLASDTLVCMVAVMRAIMVCVPHKSAIIFTKRRVYISIALGIIAQVLPYIEL